MILKEVNDHMGINYGKQVRSIIKTNLLPRRAEKMPHPHFNCFLGFFFPTHLKITVSLLFYKTVHIE